MKPTMITLWFMLPIIGDHASISSFIIGSQKEESSARQLTENLLESSSQADHATGLPDAGEIITSTYSESCWDALRNGDDEFLSQWLVLYYLRQGVEPRYGIDLNKVPFLSEVKNAFDTHVRTRTDTSKDKLLLCLGRAFMVAKRLDQTTADSKIKLGAFFVLLAEITEVEKDIPRPLAREVKDKSQGEILSLSAQLEPKSPLLHRIAQQLLKLWNRRKGIEQNVSNVY